MQGEDDCGDFGNGSGWPEREEVRGGSAGELGGGNRGELPGNWGQRMAGEGGGGTGEIVELLQGRCSRSSANGGWRWRG